MYLVSLGLVMWITSDFVLVLFDLVCVGFLMMLPRWDDPKGPFGLIFQFW